MTETTGPTEAQVQAEASRVYTTQIIARELFAADLAHVLVTLHPRGVALALAPDGIPAKEIARALREVADQVETGTPLIMPAHEPEEATSTD